MVAANQQKKAAQGIAGQMAANAPQPINIGQAIGDYMGAMTNPDLQRSIIDAEGTFRPQYQALNQRDLQNALVGVGGENGYFGTLDLQDMAAGRAAALNQSLQTQNTEFQLDQIKAYGPEAMSAYFAANPLLGSAYNDAVSMGGRQNSGYLNRMGQLAMQSPMQAMVMPQAGSGFSPISADQISSGGTLTPQQVQSQQIQAERIAAGQVQAGQVGGGALGQSLYQQALQAQQLSPLSQALQTQGLGMAQAPGQLSPQEIRAATQGSREGFAASGRLNDNASIAGEALARAGAARERTYQDLSAAQGINQQLLGAQQAGQALATDVLRTDIARQQGNVGTALQAGTFNVDAALRANLANQSTGLAASQSNQGANLQAQLANQSAGMQAGMFNIQNAQNVQQMNQAANLQAALANQSSGQRGFEFGATQNLGAQLSNRDFAAQQAQQQFSNLGTVLGGEQAMLGADRAYTQNMLNFSQGVLPQALNMIGFGQNAAAIPMGANFLQMAQGQAGIQGPQLFNPDAGINLALAQQANQAGYGAAVAGGQAALGGASINANSRLMGGAMQGLGGMLGGIDWGSIFNRTPNPNASMKL